MRPIAVIPPEATERIAPLLGAAGWDVDEAAEAFGDEPAAALDVVRLGEPAVYVPRGAAPAGQLDRILVVHEGSRGSRASMDAADEAAVATGAEIIVL